MGFIRVSIRLNNSVHVHLSPHNVKSEACEQYFVVSLDLANSLQTVSFIDEEYFSEQAARCGERYTFKLYAFGAE